jgi:hypothetical protein
MRTVLLGVQQEEKAVTARPETSADSQRILAALMGLHRAYPLERRIKQEACDGTRETYLAILLRWMQTGVAPSTDGFDREALDELAALDAIFIADGQIGCPPFSAVATDIQVHFPHETLHALSALDALALPRILNTAATIEARCAMSGAPVSVTVMESGALRAADLDGAVVAFEKVADNVARYAFDLAPGIRFVLPQYRPALRQTVSLVEASAIANAFYAFPRQLLRG